MERGGGGALAGGGGGLSQAQIIQDQALAIAELEDRVARADEYRARTKLRLKEAAQRLREYRLRADALAAELETAKKDVEAARRARSERRPATRAVAVQTEKERQRTADAGAQTEVVRGRDQGAQTERSTEVPDPLELLLEPNGGATAEDTDVPDLLRPVAFDGANPTSLPLADATSAVIDAELALSDSDDELEAERASSAVTSQAVKVDLDAEISSAIDEELGTSSDEEEPQPLRLNSAVSAAVDAELATSDEEEAHEPSVSALRATKPAAPEPNVRAQLLKSIDDEIDTELAFSSEGEEAPTTKGTGHHSSASSSDSSSSGSSDDDGGKESDADGLAGEIEAALAGEAPQATDNHAGEAAEASHQPLGVVHSKDSTSALAMTLRRTDHANGRAGPSTIDESKDTSSALASTLRTVAAANERVDPNTTESNNDCPTPTAEPDEIEGTTQEDVGDVTETSEVEPGEISNPSREDGALAVPVTQVNESDASYTQVASPSRKRSIDEMHRDEPMSTDDPVVKKHKMIGDELAGPEGANESIELVTTRLDVHLAANPKVEHCGSAQASQPTKKRDTYLLKARQAFKRELMRVDGEELDTKYLGRTFAALVRCSAAFFESHPQHVASLCTAVTKLYRDNNVSPMLALQGALRVFRTPRTRNALKNESKRLGELCKSVLLQLMSPSDPAKEAEAPDASAYWEMDQCLSILRGLVIDEKLPLENLSVADAGASSKPSIMNDLSSRIEVTKASHDKTFLVHVCALHAKLCQATGLLHRSRVFLFDVVRTNVNIVGLHLAATMIEISPELVATELDEKFRERQMILKDAVLHVLVMIAGVASMKQQELFNETGVEMMHRISKVIQREDLDESDGTCPSFQRDFVKSLAHQVFTAPDVVISNAEASFQVGKSLELLAAFHGPNCLSAEFSLSRFRETFREYDMATNQLGKAWTATIAGHCVSAMASSRDSEAVKYVEEAAGWFAEQLFIPSTEESRGWQLPCAASCVDIALSASALEATIRRRSVQAALRWFDLQPTERLMQMPALFIRKLRYAMLSTRPPRSQLESP